MSKVRDILFLSQRVPYPPDRGDRITTWHILRHFLDAGHRVRIGCFTEDKSEVESVNALRERGAQVFHARLRGGLGRIKALPWLLTRQPLTRPWFAHRGLRRALRATLRDRPCDLCYAYSSSMGFYMLDLAAELDTARKVAHFAELDSDKWAQYATTKGFPAGWVYSREARRLLEWETKLARAADTNVVVSDVERRLFEERIPDTPVDVLPNGVDVETFHPGTDTRRANNVVFTGQMGYLPNVDAVKWFVERCWPAIRARHTDATFTIVGSGPTQSILALDGHDGIEVTGRVPSTVPYMQRASIAVAPLRMARGIQNKVLEAMACGLPTVVSPKAFLGIDATDGEHLVVADGAAATTDAVLELLAQQDSAAALGAAARRRVALRYDWTTILAALDGIVGFAVSEVGA